MIGERLRDGVCEGHNVMAVPGGMDHTEDVVCNQGGEAFDGEQEVRALGLKLGHAEGGDTR